MLQSEDGVLRIDLVFTTDSQRRSDDDGRMIGLGMMMLFAI
jgi:hypothetical protein